MTTKEKIEYIATAKVMGKKFSGKGSSVLKAIEKIDCGNVAGTVILSVSKGKKGKDRILPMTAARRLFNTRGLTREVALKNTANLFDGI